MSTWVWGGAAYGTKQRMLDAIALAWMTADGRNSKADVDEHCALWTPTELAREVIGVWDLDKPDIWGEGWSWMDKHGVTEAEIAQAFRDFIDNRPDRAGGIEARP